MRSGGEEEVVRNQRLAGDSAATPKSAAPLSTRWVLYLASDPEPTNWGFMAWIAAQWSHWKRATGEVLPDHAAFDQWLCAKVGFAQATAQ